VKIFGKYTVIALVTILVIAAGIVQADRKKGRKLPVKAYIQTARIGILDSQKEPERIYEAIGALDSLFMHYGHHAEGLYWMSQIQADFIQKTANLKSKRPYVEALVAYVDSLHLCCENEDIKDKYRKGCDEYTHGMDSIKAHYWITYSHDGVEQAKEVEQIVQDMKEETDSISLDHFQNRMVAKMDSCRDNLSMAILIDSSDSRPYVGLASIFEKREMFDSSIFWLDMALQRSEKKQELLLKLAYNNIQLDKFCEAIPYFRDYVNNVADDEAVMADSANREAVLGTMFNLSVCYNNCDMYDSAYAVYHRMLVLDSADAAAVSGAGRYCNRLARSANDSASHYQEVGDETQMEHWRGVKDNWFDSAKVYFGRAFELSPDNVGVAVEFGITSVLVQDFDGCVTAFSRATELDPSDTDSWISLGDCQLRQQNFEGAAAAYEKAIELKPDNKPVLESLMDLHSHLGNTARKKEIEGILKNM